MKTTLKIALLASVLMATPVLAADKADNSPNDQGRNAATEKAVKLDANGNPIHRKHWRHKGEHRMNRDANPDYGAENMPHRGWRDADGNWHEGERGNVAVNRDGSRNYNYNRDGSRNYSYDQRTANGRWMGMNFESRHMKDGADTDMNNRGRHAFIFDNGQNAQDFRVGSGHVVKH